MNPVKRFRMIALLFAFLGSPTGFAQRRLSPLPSDEARGAVHAPAFMPNDSSPDGQLAAYTLQESVPAPGATPGNRPATVADSIRMTRLADPNYTGGGSSRGLVARFSPDGKRFVVVVRKGNLEKNTNEYSLLLFRTAEVFRSPRAEVLLTMSSSSNREAIKQPTWLDDNDTILFLGEVPGEIGQLYSLKCSTRELKKLTNHPTSILSYTAGSRGEHIVFTARKPSTPILTNEARREGIPISNQSLPDLIAGIDPGHPLDCDLFAQAKDSDRFVPIEIEGVLPPFHPLFLSPDGRYLVALAVRLTMPEGWNEYKDDLLQRILKGNWAISYALVDTEERTSHPLLSAPLSSTGPSDVAWLPNSRSVIVSGVYLPLNVSDPAEREARQSHAFAAEIKIPSREILPIAMRNDLKQPRYDSNTGELTFEFGREREPSKVVYRKKGGRWEQAKPESQQVRANPSIEIHLEEDCNTPPRIVAINPTTGEKAMLLDLNPQLRELRLASVERVTWKATDGHLVDGGLYRPPDFTPGKKYPLVIQTHGFNPQRFSMGGIYDSTAFAAQALANKGFFVLQANEGAAWMAADVDPKEANKYMVTPQENPREMASYEGAIDYLDSLGLIDRTRVGLIGFSRTGMHVQYALTHSKYEFAAASVTDGIDASYFQYVAFSSATPEMASEFEQINDGSPFGAGLARWLELAPGFRLDKVAAPLRLEAIGPWSLLGYWEWPSGLRRLEKPVELVYIPDGTHLLEKPWERMISQQGNVDWFCFWLKGEEDPDPAKAAQYARWQELRKQFEKEKTQESRH